MTNIRRITAPAETPVTLAAAKAHLRVDHDDDDDLITALIDTAVSHLDGWRGILGRAIVSQTWAFYLDRFPAGAIRLPLGDLISVDEVSYIDPEDVVTVIDPADYVVDDKSPDGRLVPAGDFVWPVTAAGINVVQVTYTCGFGAASAVPAAIKTAILMMVSGFYEHRDAQTTKPIVENEAVMALLRPLRRLEV